MLQVFVYSPRAAAEDVANVLAGFAQRNPVEHFGFALREAEGGDQRFDSRGVVFFAQHDQPFLLAGLVVEGGEQPPTAIGKQQGGWLAAVAAGAFGFADPRQQARRCFFLSLIHI